MNENDKQAEPVGLCGHESCDCRGYCQKLKENPAEPVAQPYAHIYEFDSAVFGTHRSFSPSQWNGMKPTRTVVVYTHPAQPVQPAGAQEIKGWLITSKADENESFVTKRPDDWNNSDWKKEPLCTAPPAAAINEQLLEALKELTSTFEMFAQGITVPKESVVGRQFASAHAAIFKAEKAKRGE